MIERTSANVSPMAIADAATAVITAIEELALANLDEDAPNDIKPLLKALKVSSSKLDAKIGQITHAADAAGEYIGTGSRDTAGWLAKETGTSAHKNRGAAELGAAMARSDELTEALSTGTISTDKASVAVGAAADETIDAALLDEIADLPLNSVKPAVEQWRARNHPDRDADQARVQRDRRFLKLTGLPDGMTRIEGLLDPLSAAKVRATLDSVMNASAFDGTGRTRDQRCADSLTQLCDAASKGEIKGGRSNAKLMVTAPFETLVERSNERGRTHVGPTLDAAAVRQLACDAGIHRVITGPASSILEFGHETRLVSENQFTALVVRDQHCRWPGCTIRATWCDAHHITEWTEYGPTNLDNLALLCHRHHQMSHQPGWSISGNGNTIEIHHPDGSLDISKPPGEPRPTEPRAGKIGRSGQPSPARRGAHQAHGQLTLS